MNTSLQKKHRLALIIAIFTIAFTAKISAQVTFLDSAKVTNDALYFWKADDPKPYHYGASINPHGSCVKVSKGYVFYTWYRGGWNDRKLMVSRMKIGTSKWEHVVLPPVLSLVGGKGDTHLTTNIGICPIDSTIHLIYDLHNEDLKYIVSKKGVAYGSDSAFNAVNFLPQQNYFIPGKPLSSVTYPGFTLNDMGEMYFQRRLGSAVGGSNLVSFYNGKVWSNETTILQGTGSEVSQGERNYAYGGLSFMSGNFYFNYSVRWAESPTELNEGVYLINLGPTLTGVAKNLKGKSYNLPIIDHKPFLIADPRSNPTTLGFGVPQFAVSPKNDFYLNISPKNTPQYNYLKKTDDTEFAQKTNMGSLGSFYKNRMYKFEEANGYLIVKSCLAGTYDWVTDFSMFVGARFNKSNVQMDDGIITAVYAETKASDKVPIHCYVFKIDNPGYTAQTINFSDIPEKTEGDADFTLNATATSNLPIKYSSSNTNIARIVDGNKVKVMGVGTCNIIANQSGNGLFDYAPAASKELIVKANTSKSNQTINFTLATTNYVWETTPEETLNATATSGLQVQYESSDTTVAFIVDGKLRVKRAGKTIISALQAGNATYNAAPLVSHELNVPKRTQVLTFTDIPEKFSGDPEFNLQVTSNNPNANLRYVCPNNQAAIVWDKTVRHLLGPGNAVITISDEGDDYFTAAQVSKTLVVKAKTHVVPKLIEAEHFSAKSGTDVTRWSNSIFYMNQFAPNDWAEYAIDVPSDGNYTIELRTASTAANSQMRIVSGTTTLATVLTTASPNLTTFKSNSVTVPLTKGIQNLRIVGVSNILNFDYLKITSGGTITPPPVVNPDLDPMSYTVVSVDTEQVPNYAKNLFDGISADASRWSAQVFPKSVVIDLGEEKRIIGTKVYTYQNRAYKYKIELSDAPSSDFNIIVDRTANTSGARPIVDDFAVQTGRYVKLTVTGVHNVTTDWSSINELVLVYDGETAVRNISELSDWVGVYPNPTNSTFKVRMKGMDSAKVQIYTLSGQMVYNELISDKTLSLPTGVYVLKAIGSNQKIYREKLIVK